MRELSWIGKLKSRWNITNTYQVILILIVFACTGISVFLLKRPLLTWLSGSPEVSTLGTILYYVLILPLYNLLLLVFGFVFGQFNFFWQFERKFFLRVKSIFTKNNNRI